MPGSGFSGGVCILARGVLQEGEERRRELLAPSNEQHDHRQCNTITENKGARG